jgi:hypothetical protein
MADDITSPIAGAEIVTEEGSKPITTEEIENAVVSESEEDFIATTPGQPFDQTAFESLKNLVSRKAFQVDELQKKVKELNESLKNIFINDSVLSEAEETLKQTKKTVTKRKADLNSSPEAQSIKSALIEAREELKDIEDSLSTQLLNLYQMTGVQEFETNTGEVREFVIKAKVKAKKK